MKGTAAKAPTVNQKPVVLNRVFTLAVENGYLSQNPAAKVRRLKEGARRERVMSYEEEENLRRVMRDARYFDLLGFFKLAVNTGMRAEEVVGLQFSEVDFEGREIRLPAGRTKEG
jgi:integrase/recombinase XerC